MRDISKNNEGLKFYCFMPSLLRLPFYIVYQFTFLANEISYLFKKSVKFLFDIKKVCDLLNVIIILLLKNFLYFDLLYITTKFFFFFCKFIIIRIYL